MEIGMKAPSRLGLRISDCKISKILVRVILFVMNGKFSNIFEYFCKLRKSNTTTLFEMGRCTDETCKEIDNNAILDVSPNSKEDPLTWFKVDVTNDSP